MLEQLHVYVTSRANQEKIMAKEIKISACKIITSDGFVCCYYFFEREILSSESYPCNISKLSQVEVVIIRLRSLGRMLKA